MTTAADRPAGGEPARANASAPARGFPSQADAETWLGQVWRDLAGGGVRDVSLYDGDRLVYGPMSLDS